MQEITVNFKYVEHKIKEAIQTDLVIRELHQLMNDYCIEVTGKEGMHIWVEEVYKMFPNIEMIDFTIAYTKSCLEGISEKEKMLMLKMINKLEVLKQIKLDEIPF